MAQKKARQTMEKLRREQERKRKREDKAQKKQHRKDVKAGIVPADEPGVGDEIEPSPLESSIGS